MGTCAWETNLQRSNAGSEGRRADADAAVAGGAIFAADSEAALARNFVPCSN